MTGDLAPAELTAAGEAFADVHSWSAVAWRQLAGEGPSSTRESVLDDIDVLAGRLTGLRKLLDSSQDTP